MARKPLGRVASVGALFGQRDTSRVHWITTRGRGGLTQEFPTQCGLCGNYNTNATIQVKITVLGTSVTICRSCLSEIHDFVPLDATQEEQQIDEIKKKSPLKSWVSSREKSMEWT